MSRSTPLLHPMGYFVSWRTYGTWLQGDPRGWNRRGTPGTQRPDPVILARCKESLRFPPLWLTRDQRAWVEDAIREICDHRDWPLHFAMALSGHVHVVVSAPVSPEKVLHDLKSWATRRLRARESALADRAIWGRHGSTRYLHTIADIRGAVEYVRDDHHLR